MPTWNNSQLATVGAAAEIDIAPLRRDGTPGGFVTIWVVRVGDDVCVRSFHGPDGHWYRATQTTGRGRIRVAGVEHDVAFEPAPDADTTPNRRGSRSPSRAGHRSP